MAVLKLDWEGKERVLDLEGVTSREYKVIKRHTGMRFGEFEMALRDARTQGVDVEVIDCLLWLFLKRDGQGDCDPATLADYSPLTFMENLDVIPEEGKEVEDDPKATSTPASDTSESTE